ncbi:MAG: flagellin [Candidatus Sedimenticola sp. (ex Thyasira tokunagai)]
MAVTVNTNLYSLAARRNISRSQINMQTAVQRLSSGLRINMAKDDAAGLAVGQFAEMQARGAALAQQTLGDSMSRLQVQDTTLQTANEMLQRVRELALQKLSGTYSDSQKSYISTEMDDLGTELGAMLARVQFNGAGAFGTFASVASSNGSTINFGQAAPTLSGISNTTALASVVTIMGTVNLALAKIGADESVAEKTLNTAMAVEESQWAAYGRTMDADIARETARLTSAQVVQQAGIAALAQANTMPQLALGLLG